MLKWIKRAVERVHADLLTSRAWTWEDEARQMAFDRPAIQASRLQQEHDEHHRRFPTIERGSILCGYCQGGEVGTLVHLDLRGPRRHPR